jgi:hypothetical protein
MHLDVWKTTHMDKLVHNSQALSLENTAATIQTNCVGSFQIITSTACLD